MVQHWPGQAREVSVHLKTIFIPLAEATRRKDTSRWNTFMVKSRKSADDQVAGVELVGDDGWLEDAARGWFTSEGRAKLGSF